MILRKTQNGQTYPDLYEGYSSYSTGNGSQYIRLLN